LGIFATGYVAMARHITNAGAFYKAHMFARTCVRRGGSSHVHVCAVLIGVGVMLCSLLSSMWSAR
jgi:hypothetical protein